MAKHLNRSLSYRTFHSTTGSDVDALGVRVVRARAYEAAANEALELAEAARLEAARQARLRREAEDDDGNVIDPQQWKDANAENARQKLERERMANAAAGERNREFRLATGAADELLRRHGFKSLFARKR